MTQLYDNKIDITKIIRYREKNKLYIYPTFTQHFRVNSVVFGLKKQHRG